MGKIRAARHRSNDSLLQHLARDSAGVVLWGVEDDGEVGHHTRIKEVLYVVL